MSDICEIDSWVYNLSETWFNFKKEIIAVLPLRSEALSKTEHVAIIDCNMFEWLRTETLTAEETKQKTKVCEYDLHNNRV